MFTAEGGLTFVSRAGGWGYGYVFPPIVPFVGSGRGNGMEDLANLLELACDYAEGQRAEQTGAVVV